MPDRKYEERGTSFKPAIKWETKGQKIEGEYVGKRTGIGVNNSTVYEVIVTDDKGEQALEQFWGTTVLDRKMTEVKVGEFILVEYLGEAKSPKGNKFKDFKVMAAEGDGTTDEDVAF